MFCSDPQLYNKQATQSQQRKADHVHVAVAASSSNIDQTSSEPLMCSKKRKRIHTVTGDDSRESNAVVHLESACGPGLEHVIDLVQSRVVDLQTPPNSLTTDRMNVREVDLPDSSKGRCGHCGGNDATWLFWIRRHLCSDCRHLSEYKTICRSQARKQFGLSFAEIINGEDEGSLHVFHVPNPHNTGRNAGRDNGSKWMHLYYLAEVQAYATYLGRKQEPLQSISYHTPNLKHSVAQRAI